MFRDHNFHTIKFRDNYEKVAASVILTNNWVTNQFRERFRELDLTIQQFIILRILSASETPLSTMEIRDRMLAKMSDSSRIVDKLIEKGFVKKIINKNDKRFVDITLTNNGKELMYKVNSQEDTVLSTLKHLSAEETETLIRLLEKIRS